MPLAEILDWTRWNDGETVTDAVAYSWGCADSIADFNADLEEQRAALTAYYADTNIELLGENPDPSEHRNWSPWEPTVAPGPEGNDKWFNYLWGEFDPDTETYNSLTINGTKYNPYIPGLSTWKQRDQGNYHDYDSKRSAGTDCSGYIQKCAGYTGNPYFMPDIQARITWGGGSEDLIGPGGFADGTYTWPVVDRNLLVPGDVLSSSGHVAMVWKIVYQDGTRIIQENVNGTSNSVFVIEATKGPRDQWKVMNSQIWSDLGVGYELRRLRAND